MAKSKTLKLEAEKNASDFRARFGLSGTEPVNLTSFLIKINVITAFRPLSDSLSGMAIKAGDIRFILVNQKNNLGRQNFTLGHELYHLFLQEDFTARTCQTGIFDKQTEVVEQQADLFAAAFLLPEAGIMQVIPSSEITSEISEETLFKIQHYFGVSMKCLIFRLVELDLVSKKLFDKYQDGVKKAARRLGYDLALYESGNHERVIGNYGSLASELYKNDRISESFYLELMNAINVDPYSTVDLDE